MAAKKTEPRTRVHINRGEGPYYEHVFPAPPRKGTATPADGATVKTKGAAGRTPAAAVHSQNPAAPADTSALADEPPPALVPPEVQAEIDRLIRVNRALRAALRELLKEE